MVKKTKSAWERLQMVLEASGCKNLNNLGTALGLKRSETLYQIKRGNYEISKFLAKRIHHQFPQFSISWLYLGEETASSEQPETQAAVAQNQVPLVRLTDFHKGESGESGYGELYLSQCMAGNATYFLNYNEDLLHPRIPQNSMIFLREWTASIIWGRIYLVKTQEGEYIRIIRKTNKPDHIKLTIARTSKKDDIYIRTSDIHGIYLVSGHLHLS